MEPTLLRQKRILQILVAVFAVTPVLIGLAGVVYGPSFLGLDPPWPTNLDSHFRFLCGIFLALGLGWYSCIPDLELKTGRARLLGALTFAGGLARLLSLFVAGAPSAGHLAGLGMELVVVPLLVFWQGRIAERARETR